MTEEKPEKLSNDSRVPAEIQTGHFPNTNQKHYHFNQLAEREMNLFRPE
jgi:hypothetical protein